MPAATPALRDSDCRGHRDPDQHVAAVAHQPREPLALAADHQDERGGGELELGDRDAPGGIEAGDHQPLALVGLQRAGEVRDPRDRHPRGGPGRRLPGTRRHPGRSPLRYDDAVDAERRRRAHDGPEVARVGHRVERDQQGRPAGVRGPRRSGLRRRHSRTAAPSSPDPGGRRRPSSCRAPSGRPRGSRGCAPRPA